MNLQSSCYPTGKETSAPAGFPSENKNRNRGGAKLTSTKQGQKGIKRLEALGLLKKNSTDLE